ncbi:MAG: DUF1848 domain-containing protein [Clostridiales bacterium]|nr:DUF1848 domain-containing protein [Clostridiales bacterium]
MIVSASRRTDIPALYAAWFAARLRDGEALVRQPYRPRSVVRVDLSAQAVDGVVLWTKNAAPFLPVLTALAPRPFYFQFTLNPYGAPLEPGLPELAERIDTFRELSSRIGRHRVVWRYDPVVLSERTPPDYHLEQFDRLVRELCAYTDKCVISFLDTYARNRRALAQHRLREASADEMNAVASGFAAIARERGLSVECCCEAGLTADSGVLPGRCIDAALLSRIAGRPLTVPRDSGQRPGCGCARSVDIGAYGTCGHGCVYCYANGSAERVRRNLAAHDPESPLLTGNTGE